MPRKRPPGRPRKHGGRREGAGRKPLEGQGTQPVTVTLTAKQIERVERWQEQQGLDNFSEAIRQIIDTHLPG